METNAQDQPPRNILRLRLLAMLLFGIIAPAFIAWKADGRISEANRAVQKATEESAITEVLINNPYILRTANDYSLVTYAESERANLSVVVNKQMMKLVVIYMGFSVMSFAIMFIILGFSDKPIDAKGQAFGGTFDVRFGSIGAAVFVAGAAMSAAGGLVPNPFKTTGIPAYAIQDLDENVLGEPMDLLGYVIHEAIQNCRTQKSDDDRFECVIDQLSVYKEG